ncbi:hypothetical protein H0H92_009439 [Tricholoma furcatifolium]|nr:hypothetical protein H0H92_009439 [Tricholoma furcatifolium]
MAALLRAKVGDHRLQRKIALEGHRFTPKEAYDDGLVDHLITGKTADVLAKAEEIADKFSSNAQGGTWGLIKTDLYRDTLVTFALDPRTRTAAIEDAAARSRFSQHAAGTFHLDSSVHIKYGLSPADVDERLNRWALVPLLSFFPSLLPLWQTTWSYAQAAVLLLIHENMHFSSLLAGVLLALYATALPTPKPSPEPEVKTGLVTLPLKRLAQRSSNVHPLIAHQQNVNRSYRRYARMTGRRQPTSEELHENLRKRVLAVEGEEGLQKRYNRFGVPSATDANLERRFNRLGVPKKSTSTGSGAVLAAAAAANERHTNQDKEGHHNQGGDGTSASSDSSSSSSSSSTAAETVAIANAPTANNSLGLDIEGDDVGYLATIQIGTPAQDFLILMDSGSADFWVGSENCVSESGGGCGNHTFLGTQSSSSFVDTGSPFSVTYGTGSVAGDIVTDDVSIAGLSLPNHKFGVATEESVDFSADTIPFDGLMGLAQSTLSEQQTLTPVESLAQQGLISDAITSYKISRLADNLNDGEITFGGLDPTKFDASTLVTFDNVNTQGFWEGAMDAITVNGADTGLQGRTAILDTGTTLIVAPPSDAAAVHQLIPGAQDIGQGSFTVPCTTNVSVALSFGGSSFSIDPRDIAFTPVDASDPTGDCISGISSGEIGAATEWLVGDVFLKNAYYSTDVGNNAISLAKLSSA